MMNILQIDTVLEYTLPHTQACFEILESLSIIKEKLQIPFFERLVPMWRKYIIYCLGCNENQCIFRCTNRPSMCMYDSNHSISIISRKYLVKFSYD